MGGDRCHAVSSFYSKNIVRDMYNIRANVLQELEFARKTVRQLQRSQQTLSLLTGHRRVLRTKQTVDVDQ